MRQNPALDLSRHSCLLVRLLFLFPLLLLLLLPLLLLLLRLLHDLLHLQAPFCLTTVISSSKVSSKVSRGIQRHTPPRLLAGTCALQHTATNCNTLQQKPRNTTVIPCCTPRLLAGTCALQHTATHTAIRCNTLQHTQQQNPATQISYLVAPPTFLRARVHYNTLQRTLQHTATHCNTLQPNPRNTNVILGYAARGFLAWTFRLHTRFTTWFAPSFTTCLTTCVSTGLCCVAFFGVIETKPEFLQFCLPVCV